MTKRTHRPLFVTHRPDYVEAWRTTFGDCHRYNVYHPSQASRRRLERLAWRHDLHPCHLVTVSPDEMTIAID